MLGLDPGTSCKRVAGLRFTSPEKDERERLRNKANCVFVLFPSL